MKSSFYDLDTYSVLDSARVSDEDKRLALTEYLVEMAQYHRDHPEDGRGIASFTAGLLSTAFCMDLGNSDPLIKILSLTGALELPKELHLEGEDWETLEKLVSQLPRT